MNHAIDRNRLIGVTLAVLATLVVAFAGPTRAQAHTTVQSVSANGKLLRITFSGPIRSGTIRATNSRGKVISRGRGGRDPRNITRLRVALKNVRSGWYTASWRMVAIDGHGQGGKLRFKVR